MNEQGLIQQIDTALEQIAKNEHEINGLQKKIDLLIAANKEWSEIKQEAHFKLLFGEKRTIKITQAMHELDHRLSVKEVMAIAFVQGNSVYLEWRKGGRAVVPIDLVQAALKEQVE